MGRIAKEQRQTFDHHQHSRLSRAAGPTGWASQFVLFAKGFLRHPNMVGWVLPSSPFLVDEVLKKVDWERARVIVEYGPGVGAFTTRVLLRMRPDARLIALEINPEFFQFLNGSLKDPRLRLVQESAAEIDAVLQRLGCGPADCIISGIPFKTLPDALRHTIVRKTHDVLRPNGSFLVYQFSDAVRPYLEGVFSKVSRGFALLNIIPARLFFCAR
jgi:phospholipid N-methyltransferase